MQLIKGILVDFQQRDIAHGFYITEKIRFIHIAYLAHEFIFGKFIHQKTFAVLGYAFHSDIPVYNEENFCKVFIGTRYILTFFIIHDRYFIEIILYVVIDVNDNIKVYHFKLF